jgi:hypothetical protein
MLTTEQKRILAACVTRGARLLDRVRPKWFKRVRAAAKKGDLHIYDGTMCVLGHVYRDAARAEARRHGVTWRTGYDIGLQRLNLEKEADARYGFNTSEAFDEVSNEAGSYLEEAWARAAERRAVAA